MLAAVMSTIGCLWLESLCCLVECRKNRVRHSLHFVWPLNYESSPSVQSADVQNKIWLVLPPHPNPDGRAQSQSACSTKLIGTWAWERPGAERTVWYTTTKAGPITAPDWHSTPSRFRKQLHGDASWSPQMLLPIRKLFRTTGQIIRGPQAVGINWSWTPGSCPVAPASLALMRREFVDLNRSQAAPFVPSAPPAA